jgi:5'-3' exonuclease
VKVRGAKALAENLRAHRDDTALYKTLATLRTDVPLAETLPDLRWRGADRALLEPLAVEIGAQRLVARVPTWRAD